MGPEATITRYPIQIDERRRIDDVVSSFAGALTARQRWQILDAVKAAHDAAGAQDGVTEAVDGAWLHVSILKTSSAQRRSRDRDRRDICRGPRRFPSRGRITYGNAIRCDVPVMGQQREVSFLKTSSIAE